MFHVKRSCWIIVDAGKVGTEKQCIALAQALGVEFVVKRLRAKWPWKWLPPRMWVSALSAFKEEISLKNPPSIVIAGGRACAALAAKLKEKGCFTIFILDPYIKPEKFDVVIAPRHDHVKGDNVIEILGSLSNIEEPSSDIDILENCNEGIKIALLIGGNSKHHTFNKKVVEEFSSLFIKMLKSCQACVWVTFSRRTPIAYQMLLKQKLSGQNIWIWDGLSANPYTNMLMQADYIIVTSDSISMVSEALSTGKPVYIIDIPTSSAKFREFYATLESRGYIKLFKGELEKWTYSPLKEVERCASIIQHKLSVEKSLTCQISKNREKD